jgi:hypothetical protein
MCSICLEDIKTWKRKFTTSCQHSFHLQCINQWKILHNTCPLCRQTIICNSKQQDLLFTLCYVIFVSCIIVSTFCFVFSFRLVISSFLMTCWLIKCLLCLYVCTNSFQIDYRSFIIDCYILGVVLSLSVFCRFELVCRLFLVVLSCRMFGCRTVICLLWLMSFVKSSIETMNSFQNVEK